MVNKILEKIRTRLGLTSNSFVVDLTDSTLWVIVIDVSPSMDFEDYPPSRLGAAQKAACTFISNRAGTSPSDYVAVIVFGGTAKTLLFPSLVSSNTTLESLRKNFSSQPFIGKTCIGNAFHFTGSELSTLQCLISRTRVLLLTDGHSHDDPVPHATALKEMGAVIEIVGIGGSPDSVNERVLRQCASFEYGRALYRFIGDEEELVKHFYGISLEGG